jgi:hypothetical protein
MNSEEHGVGLADIGERLESEDPPHLRRTKFLERPPTIGVGALAPATPGILGALVVRTDDVAVPEDTAHVPAARAMVDGHDYLPF